MTNALNLHQRLRAQTGQARREHAEVEAQVEEKQDAAAQPGDLYLLAETADQGIEWAVLEADDSQRLVVPADTNPLIGSADVAVPEDATRGPLTLRCRFGVRLDADRLTQRRRAGALESIYLEHALAKRHSMDAPTVREQRMDSDPEYQAWVSEVLEPACDAARGEPLEPRPRFLLEGFSDKSHKTWRTRIPGAGLNIGRRSGEELVLRPERVSRPQAKLFLRGNRHWIRDLGSTAGTFVNSKRITDEQPIRNGDVVAFGDRELRYVVNVPGGAEPDQWKLLPQPSRPLTELRRERLNRIVRFEARFQPVVRLEDFAPAGYELVGAGDLDGTPWLTPALFQIARRLGREAEIADLRTEGLDEAENLPSDLPVLVNIDVEELEHDDLLTDSLRELRRRHPNKTLVVEIEGDRAPDRATLEKLSSRLQALGIGLAFHDFGDDETRLEDLIHVHPRFVKFGPGWTRDLHHASQSRRRMVGSLVQIMSSHKILTVAEGISYEEQSLTCRELGFDLGQGQFYGSPTVAGMIAPETLPSPPPEL